MPDEAGQVGVLEALLASLPSLWTLPPRQVARLLQRAGLRVWVTDGEVVRVGFV